MKLQRSDDLLPEFDRTELVLLGVGIGALVLGLLYELRDVLRRRRCACAGQYPGPKLEAGEIERELERRARERQLDAELEAMRAEWRRHVARVAGAPEVTS